MPAENQWVGEVNAYGNSAWRGAEGDRKSSRPVQTNLIRGLPLQGGGDSC